MFVFIPIIVSLCTVQVSAADSFFAEDRLIVVDKFSREQDVSLKGYDSKGRRMSYEVTSLPAVGTLWQTSQIYCDHGYTPKRSSTSQISSPGEAVACAKRGRHLMYTYPKNLPAPSGKFGSFEYSVKIEGLPGCGRGIVTLVDSTRVLTISDFRRGTDGFTIIDNAGTKTPQYDPSSSGLLNQFITGTSLEGWHGHWYFNLPSEYLGFQAPAYGGSLGFTLGSSSGDFSLLNSDVHEVIMTCDACDNGKGITLATRPGYLKFTGATKRMIVPMSESVWVKDPKNVNMQWPASTKCELVQVLTQLSSIRILGDFTQRHESVSIDTVALVAGDGAHASCSITHTQSYDWDESCTMPFVAPA